MNQVGHHIQRYKSFGLPQVVYIKKTERQSSNVFRRNC